MATMFGWLRPATATASRRKRSATTGSAASGGLSTFTATGRVKQDVGGQPDLGHAALRDATLEAIALCQERRRGDADEEATASPR